MLEGFVVDDDLIAFDKYGSRFVDIPVLQSGDNFRGDGNRLVAKTYDMTDAASRADR
ncbi:hypothetical protein D9M69_478320 [compost metagenome]